MVGALPDFPVFRNARACKRSGQCRLRPFASGRGVFALRFGYVSRRFSDAHSARSDRHVVQLQNHGTSAVSVQNGRLTSGREYRNARTVSANFKSPVFESRRVLNAEKLPYVRGIRNAVTHRVEFNHRNARIVISNQQASRSPRSGETVGHEAAACEIVIYRNAVVVRSVRLRQSTNVSAFRSASPLYHAAVRAVRWDGRSRGRPRKRSRRPRNGKESRIHPFDGGSVRNGYVSASCARRSYGRFGFRIRIVNGESSIFENRPIVPATKNVVSPRYAASNRLRIKTHVTPSPGRNGMVYASKGIVGFYVYVCGSSIPPIVIPYQLFYSSRNSRIIRIVRNVRAIIFLANICD